MSSVPDWKRELLRKRRTMEKAFPAWAALSERRAVHLKAPQAGPVPQSGADRHAARTRATMGEDKNVGLLSDHSDQSSVHSACTDDSEQEWEYGPGIVNRLKSKFITMSMKESGQLRSCSSLENLLDKEASERSQARKKAQSMETLLLEEHLINEDVIIIENVHRQEATRKRDRTIISDDELPKPDIVRTYKRIFEPTDKKPSVRRRPPVVRAVNGKAPFTRRRPPSVAKVISAKETVNGQAKMADVKSVSSDALARIRSQGTSVSFGAFDRKSPDTRPVANIKPIPKEVVVDEPPCDPVKPVLKESDVPADAVHEVVDALKPSSQKGGSTLWSKSPSPSTSIVFDFRGKDVKPNIAVSPAPHTKEEEDADDDLPFPSGIVFIGENVKVGKGSLLTIRNKKLRIQFDDNAVTCFEYPAEEESPVQEPFLLTSSLALGASGSLGSYTPSVLSSSEMFQLGVSRPQIAESSTTCPVQDEQQEDQLKPANPAETSSWSSSASSSDLLF